MATVTPSYNGRAPITDPYDGEVAIATWASITNADTAASVAYGSFADRSVAVTGTFGSATVVIQGSNDGSNWYTLNDLQGAALSFTAAGLKGIAEVTLYIRPSASGGGGTQSVTVKLFARRGA